MKWIWGIIKLLVELLLVAAVLGGLVVLQAVRRAEERISIEGLHREQGMPVRVVQPERRDLTDYVFTDGAVEADNRSVLRAQVEEIVEAVHAKVGERVEEGQLLVEFRTFDFEAEVEARRTANQEAKKNYERFKALYDEGHVTLQALEQRQTALDTTAAALRWAESRLRFTRVHAPMSGVVEKRTVEAGEYKSMGEIMMTIVDLSQVIVRAAAPGEVVGKLSVGKAAEFRLEDQKSWRQAAITRVSPSSDDPNRFFDIYMEVQNVRNGANWQMLPGMYAEVRFPGQEVKSALALPRHTIRDEQGQQFVFVVVRGAETDRRGGSGGLAGQKGVRSDRFA